ncbi:MAG TPA: glycosyltransferase [Candidatus Polarisedimenticolia bacterium]
MSLLRIAHLVEGLEVGGLERVVQALARHADRRRYRVEVIALSRGGPLVEEIEAGGTPVRVLDLRSYYPGDILRAARALCREVRPDLVHSHGHFAGALGRAAAFWAGIPAAIHHLHTLDTSLRIRHRGLERALARITRRILCCSHAVEKFAAEVHGLPRPLLVTIPNGIDPAPVMNGEAARELMGGAPLEAPVVGCVGSLRAHKGQEVLLRACALLGPRFVPGTLVFVGEGPEQARLERLAALSGLSGRVRFLGRRSDVRRLLPGFDLVVVPSIEREGLGLAALEAMDAARPVIASRVGGLVEVIEDGRTGILVPPGDPEVLCGAIRSIFDRPDRGRGLGEAARWRVESEFRASRMTRRVEAIYEEALHERRAA